MISVVASNLAFTALKADGTVVSWGDPLRGGNRNLSWLPGSEKRNQRFVWNWQGAGLELIFHGISRCHMSHMLTARALTFVQVDVCKLMSHERFIRLSTRKLGLRKIMKDPWPQKLPAPRPRCPEGLEGCEDPWQRLAGATESLQNIRGCQR